MQQQTDTRDTRRAFRTTTDDSILSKIRSLSIESGVQGTGIRIAVRRRESRGWKKGL